MAPLAGLGIKDSRVLVGPETADDAGVFLWNGQALVATVDFITPVCDDPRMFGRIAAANSISDVYAMGGRPLFALNLCSFPEKVPEEELSEILVGSGEALEAAGAVLLGGHSVADPELKFGLAVVGAADPNRLLTNAGARPGNRLILTKALGTGVLINAYKAGKLEAQGLQDALQEMAKLNAEASSLALAHEATAATDITGFGLAGHALEVARASRVKIVLRFSSLPILTGFYRMVEKGVSTGSTKPNRDNVGDALVDARGLAKREQELLFDPQTSGGLLISVPTDRAPRLLRTLVESGHRAAEVGECVEGEAGIEVV
jgi:selenide,water dikinase